MGLAKLARCALGTLCKESVRRRLEGSHTLRHVSSDLGLALSARETGKGGFLGSRGNRNLRQSWLL